MARRLARDTKPPEDDYGYDDDDAYDDEEPEEEVRPSRRSRREEPEERPSRRRAVARDEEEERPSRRRPRGSESDGDDRPRFRKASDRDRDEKPAKGRSERPEGVVGKGMSAYKAESAKRASGFRTLDVPEGGRKRKLIKFLQAEPIASFYQHWVLQANGKRRPYTCLGDTCPLCGVGDRPKPCLLWNVVDLDDGLVKVWQMSKDPAKKVEERYDEAAEDGRKLDDPNYYYAVSKKKGDNSFISYKVDVVKERDVEEDFKLEPLDEDELDDLLEEAYDDSIVYIPSVRDLQAVAEDLED